MLTMSKHEFNQRCFFKLNNVCTCEYEQVQDILLANKQKSVGLEGIRFPNHLSTNSDFKKIWLTR